MSRRLKVESKTFVFSKEEGNFIRITERSKRVVKYVYLSVSLTTWASKVTEECLAHHRHDGFLRTVREGNRVFIIQCHANPKGHFLQLDMYGNCRKRGSLIIPKGLNGRGWKDFVSNLRSVAGINVPVFSRLK